MINKAKHTAEPWRIGKMGAVVADIPVPEMNGSDAVEYYGGHLVGESITPSNARRIVACVNACKGILTEALESGAVKELLEQLRDARAFMEHCRWDDDDKIRKGDPIDNLKKRVDAVIALVTSKEAT